MIMNRKSVHERARILHCLVEGNSIRSTSRLMDCSKNTVLKLLVDVGQACEWYQREHFINLPCKNIQVDEIWSFVERKAYNSDGRRNHIGDVWTYTSICADTKIVPCWLIGRRNARDTTEFIADVQSRMSGRIQLTSDGYLPYINAVEQAFGNDVDYAVVIKHIDKKGNPSIKKECITGMPENKNISTSYIERQNLLMRTNIRRFQRRTNGFSKKIENHGYAVSLHFMYYNFARIHTSLRVTPAMAAGVADTLWSIEDIIHMADEHHRNHILQTP